MTPPVPADATRRRNALLLVGVGVAAVVMLGLALSQRGADPGDPVATEHATTGEVIVTGDPLPPFEGTEDDPAIGLTAPSVQDVTMADPLFPQNVGRDPQPTVVVFLAHWCPHCQRELPMLVELMKGKQLDGIRMMAVTTGTDESRPNWPPKEWLLRERWEGEHFPDGDDDIVARSYGLTGYPFFAFLDANGKVVARASGELGAEEILALVELTR